MRLFPLLTLLCLAISALAAPPRPNVILILADDLGYADVGFQGCKEWATPHLDELAATGVRCSQGYVTHPFCAPTRAALLTGRYQQRFGFEVNPAYDPHNPLAGLPPAEKTIADRLKKAGYRTGAIGNWHLGASSVHHPNHRGFDHFFGFLGGGHDYFTVDMTQPAFEGYRQPLLRNGLAVNVDGFLTHQLGREAREFIAAEAGRPFFLYLAFNAPHGPFQAPPEAVAKLAHVADKNRRAYGAMIVELDAEIGRLVDALEKNGLRENTLIAFLSDNGGPNSQPGAKGINPTSNAPLRGGKGELFEGGVRVPFIVNWPGRIKAGAYDQPVVSLDLTRTAAALAGADEAGLEGVNLVPHLRGETTTPPHEAIFFRVRDGQSWAIADATGHKLLGRKSGAPQLYELHRDLGETRDLRAESPDAVARLTAQWDAWNQANVPNAFPDYKDYHKQLEAFFPTMKP